MKCSVAWAVLVGLFVWTNAGHAQQAITIKLKDRGEGESLLVKRNEKTTTKVKVTDGGGNVLVDQKEIKTDIQEYQETTLKREAGKNATKLVRAYGKVRAGKDEQLEDGALQSKTVVIEKKGDKYTFTYKDGASVEGEAEAALIKDFSKKSDSSSELEKLVLPAQPVKAGESWKIDMRKIVTELAKVGAMELDGAQATGKGTLVKAYKKDGRQFGEMKFKMDMPIVTIGQGKEQLKFAADARIGIVMTFDVCVDGTSEAGTLKMKMTMGGNATIPSAPGATATLDVVMDATQIHEDATKK
jgi:hypothetical protein